MGKKAKKKTNRNSQKEKQIPTSSPHNISQTIPNGGSVLKEAISCPHIDTGINLDKVSLKIQSLQSSPKCEDCSEVVVDKRASKSKGKNKKKGGGTNTTSESKSIWVCLECGELSCGGIGLPTTPNTHATRHSKQNLHPLAIQFTNPNLRYCWPCKTLIPVQISEENGEHKDAFSNIVKVLKTPPSSEKNSLDVEDVWFGNGTVIPEVKPVKTQFTFENIGGFYIVKGLNNLGNTCFFNSILQNLLAMDKLRDHFLKLEKPLGPLSVSLKNLFFKTNPSIIEKNVINPCALFNSICTMAPQFKGYQQQDSHELLRFLLDGLCNEGTNVQKDHPSFVDEVFKGQICSSVSCLECGHTSVVYEPYFDLSLPLPTRKSQPKKIPFVSKSKKPNPPPRRHVQEIIEKTAGITTTESVIPPDDSNGNPDISSWLDDLVPSKVSSDSWLDYLDPYSSTTESAIPIPSNDTTFQNGNHSVVEDSGFDDELFWEEEPRRVEESEILLLPYEAIGNGNVMTEETTSEFDGFGGLFDEPEPEVISVKNEYESDSDEVDCQVSVDKCLAYFTTSEILNKTDHAWQCEQCSKTLLEQKMKQKNKHASNGTGIGIPSIPSNSGIEPSFSNGNGNGIPHIPSDSVIEDTVSNAIGNGNGNGNGNGIGNGNGNGSSELSNHLSMITDTNGHGSNGEVDSSSSSSVKAIRDASKRILISKVPPILTIHLKRLSQDARGRLRKLNGHVDFKDIIDLQPYMDPSCCKKGGTCRYQLIGVVEHVGSARGGHYVAYVRGGLKDDWLWYHASDAHVREVSLDEVFRSQAYILFYEKM